VADALDEWTESRLQLCQLDAAEVRASLLEQAQAQACLAAAERRLLDLGVDISAG
jgi:hypothetical protein